MPVRNACVARGVLPDQAAYDVYTVPANNVLLLKSIILFNNYPSPSSFIIYVHSSDGATYLAMDVSNVANNNSGIWSGWMAMNAGDRLALQAVVGTGNYWVSGAVLPYATP